jgi:hypothetical protein
MMVAKSQKNHQGTWLESGDPSMTAQLCVTSQNLRLSLHSHNMQMNRNCACEAEIAMVCEET